MKHMLLTILLFFITLSVSAQDYMVANTGSNITYYSEGEWKPLSRRDRLTEKDKIRVGKNTSLTLINTNTDEMFAYGQPGETTVGQIVAKNKTSVLKRFVNHVSSSVRNGDADKISHEATVVYRDTRADGEIYAALKDPGYNSGFLIGLELIDPETDRPIKESCKLGTKFFFRVTNHSDKALFINVLEIDPTGDLYDCLPIDEGMTMIHLLIPGNSTIDFTGYPMEFIYPSGKEQFILVAAEAPFDLRNVISLWKQNATPSKSRTPVGKFATTINVY